jgi:hypothetical protein
MDTSTLSQQACSRPRLAKGALQLRNTSKLVAVTALRAQWKTAHQTVQSMHSQPARQRHQAAKAAAQQSDAPGSSLQAATGNSSHKGHAFLHDFCMSIPYGMLIVALGLLTLVLGDRRHGALVLLGGVAILGSTTCSLIQWRAQKPSRLFTAASAAFSAMLTAQFWARVERGISTVPNTVAAALSAALLVFLVYNIFAGGNPSKRTTTEDDQRLAAAAAAD